MSHKGQSSPMGIKDVLLMALLAITAGELYSPYESKWHADPCIRDCSCLYRLRTFQNFPSIEALQNIIDISRDLPSLTISSSILPYLKASWLIEKHIFQLYIYNTTLVDLFDRPSMSVPLTCLIIDRAVIVRRIRWSHYFKHFEELRLIKVRFTQVKKFGKEFRENVTPYLKHICMQNTDTLFLADGDFDGKKLEKIQITHTQIKILKNSYFKDQKDSMFLMDFRQDPYIQGVSDKRDYIFKRHRGHQDLTL